MICYTGVAIVTCTYVGCCGSVVSTDWQAMAGKVRRLLGWQRCRTGAPLAAVARQPSAPRPLSLRPAPIEPPPLLHPASHAPQAVPTAIGGVWGMLVSALVMPHYGSSTMLEEQAGILRDAFDGMARCGCRRGP